MVRAVSSIRRPEYTGDQRCWACTAGNLALLAVGCVAIAPYSRSASLAVAVLGCVGIWLRGYLVPYTPRIAPAVATHLPFAGSHDGRPSDSLADEAPGESDAVLDELLDAGVIEVTDDDVAVDPDFEAAWHAEMERLGALADGALASATADIAPDGVDAAVRSERDRTYVVLSNGSDGVAGESWIRRPVAVAETAAARALARAGVAVGRPAAAHALGLFLQTCPECGGPIVERVAGGCCGPPERGRDGTPVQARVCESCEVRFHVLE